MKPFRINVQEGIYFCTDVVIGHANIFVTQDLFDIIISTLRFCRNEKGLLVHAYVIMPNHVHTIVSAKGGNLAGIMRDYKRFTSGKITSLLQDQGKREKVELFRRGAEKAEKGNLHKVWHTGSHPQIMDNEDKCLQKVEYIHNNPVVKGFVAKPEDWLHSSARNYLLGDDSVIDIDKLWE